MQERVYFINLLIGIFPLATPISYLIPLDFPIFNVLQVNAVKSARGAKTIFTTVNSVFFIWCMEDSDPVCCFFEQTIYFTILWIVFK